MSAIHLPPQTVSALVDASAAINAAQGLDETLAAIARAAAAVLRTEAASVIMLENGRQVFRAAVGDRAAQLLGVQYDDGLGISGKALLAGRPCMVNDVTKDRAHYKDIDLMVAFETRGMIAAPLIHQGQRLGVVEVLNPLGRGVFDEEDLELSRIFANLAAIATANAQLHDRLQRENHGLKQSMRNHHSEKMLGESPAMRKVKDLIRRVAASSATVLLLGETGTGKELAARSIHSSSPQAEHPFIAVNCAALPETLLESELFGHEAGAFTGAAGKKLGRFELAEGGTIFLDEIGEVPQSIQVKLLRVLQEKEIVRVGGTRTIACNARVIAASNRNLAQEMRNNRFREDLYYRLNVFPIEMPPLRQRREDIPLLAEHFIRRQAMEMTKRPPEISPEAMGALVRYDFPGNIRELQNILERACLLSCCNEETGDIGTIGLEQLPRELSAIGDGAAAGGSALAATEKTMVLRALADKGWNQTRAAEALGISRDNLRYRMKKYAIRPPK